MSGTAPMTISELARATGLRADTVRYYERVGLMPAPRRTSGSRRRYDAAGARTMAELRACPCCDDPACDRTSCDCC